MFVKRIFIFIFLFSQTTTLFANESKRSKRGTHSTIVFHATHCSRSHSSLLLRYVGTAHTVPIRTRRFLFTRSTTSTFCHCVRFPVVPIVDHDTRFVGTVNSIGNFSSRPARIGSADASHWKRQRCIVYV